MPQLSDEELLDWIDEFGEEELRQVLKYLILLNADAVQKAMGYVRRGRRNRSGESSVMSTSSGHFSLPSPKHVRSEHERSRSEISDDITMDTVVVVKHDQQQLISKAATTYNTAPPPQQYYQEPQLQAPPPLSTEPTIASTTANKTLLVLCTSKPSSIKQGEDQDKAMVVCKKAGIIPFIVLLESKPREAQQLIQISRVAEFPQFFLRDETTTFLGVYDTVHQMYLAGLFTTDILLKSLPPSQSPLLTVASSSPPVPSDQPPAPDTPASNQRLDTLLQRNSYDESSDDDEVSTNKEPIPGHADRLNRPSEGEVAKNHTITVVAPIVTHEKPLPSPIVAQEAVPDRPLRENLIARGDHLDGLHQPKDFDDAKSIDSAELFDPPTPPPPEKPMLAAALKAAEQIKREADLAKGVPPYLAGLNQPNVDDDAKSLGDDPRLIFDPPSPPPSRTPLLDAAKKAAAAAQIPQVMTNTALKPAPENTSPTKRVSHNKVGFSQETITLKPVGARRPSGQLGERDASGSHQPLPPSPSISKAKSPPPLQQSPPSSSASAASPLASVQAPSHDFAPPPAVVPAMISPSSSEPAWMKILAEQEQGEQKQPQTETWTNPAPLLVVPPTPIPTSVNEVAIMAQPEPTTTDVLSTTTAAPPPSLVSSSSQLIPTTTATTTTPVPSPPAQPSSSTPSALESLPTSPKKSTEAQRGVERKKSGERKYPDGGACYLVYDAVGGELNIYYSEIPIVGAVGVWTSPDILAFKEAQGLGKSELIGNCASGVQDRQQYYNGWCQFVRAAKSMDATVTILDVGVPVDFYLYLNGETRRVQSGSFETDAVDAVACVPRNADFPIDLKGKKWSKAAKKIGAVTLFRSLSARDGSGDSPTNSNATSSMVPAGSFSQLEVSATIPEEEEVAEMVMVDTNEVVAPSTNTAAEIVVPSDPPPSEPVPPVAAMVSSSSPIVEPAIVEGYASAVAAPNPPGGACYLVYEPDSSGRLVEHYSKTPIGDAIGRWVPAGSKSIAGFKFKQNLGKNVLIGNCSAGVQGRKNYSSGWCQFVRSARVMEAEVMIWDPVAKGLMVDVYLYQDDNRPTHQTVKLLPGVSQSVEKTLAVACIPKNTPFYEGMAVDILKWLADGSNYGASSRF